MVNLISKDAELAIQVFGAFPYILCKFIKIIDNIDTSVSGLGKTGKIVGLDRN